MLQCFFICVMSTWKPFWCTFLYFLRIVQYLPMKFCIDVCSTNLMVTALKCFIHILYFPADGHFRVILDQCFQCMFLYFLSALPYFLMKLYTDIFWYYSDNHCTTKGFSHHFSFSARSYFAVFFGPFWKIYHEVLYGCSWIILFQMVQNCSCLDMIHSRTWFAELL